MKRIAGLVFLTLLLAACHGSSVPSIPTQRFRGTLLRGSVGLDHVVGSLVVAKEVRELPGFALPTNPS